MSSTSRVVYPLLFGTATCGALYASLYKVEEGKRLVVHNRITGVEKTTRGEGYHFLIPYIQEPIEFDVTPRPVMVKLQAKTKDKKSIESELKIISEPAAEHLPWIYEEYGQTWDDAIISDAVQEAFQAVASEFDMKTLKNKTDLVLKKTDEYMDEIADKFNINFEDNWVPEFLEEEKEDGNKKEDVKDVTGAYVTPGELAPYLMHVLIILSVYYNSKK